MAATGSLLSFQNNLGYRFRNQDLLITALTHPSFDQKQNNQALEFLGDSLLDFLVAEFLYRQNPLLNEGEATKLRSSVVSRWPLADLYDNYEFALVIKVNNLNPRTLGVKVKSDTVEAVIGAIYIDGGIEAVREFVYKNLCSKKPVFAGSDYKSKLFEYCAKNNIQKEFTYSTQGAQHKQHFYAIILLDGVQCGSGEGGNKREAEQNACKMALEAL